MAVAAATDGSGDVNGVRGGVIEPAHLGDERTTLLGFLQRQRDLVAWKMRDASDGTLASVRMPSGLTLHGIVRHLENVERSWFREFFGGQTGLRFDWTDEDPDADMRAEGVPMAELLASYAAETELCDEVIAAASSLDATAVDPDGTYSLRWVVVHMIEETGRHLGHIDLLREQADGAVGEGPPADA
ncbi:MAG: DinB family protein [Actinobacteria bacterium]|nr:DinB family protein [Actinomycetota bacterium]